VVKVLIQYEREPDRRRYERHAAISRSVPGARFAHGKVFGNPFGERQYVYFAEFEFDDMAAFQEAARTPEFVRSGEDAAAMGIPFSVHFAEIA
jgi:hypothetical protein